MLTPLNHAQVTPPTAKQHNTERGPANPVRIHLSLAEFDRTSDRQAPCGLKVHPRRIRHRPGRARRFGLERGNLADAHEGGVPTNPITPINSRSAGISSRAPPPATISRRVARTRASARWSSDERLISARSNSAWPTLERPLRSANPKGIRSSTLRSSPRGQTDGPTNGLEPPKTALPNATELAATSAGPTGVPVQAPGSG